MHMPTHQSYPCTLCNVKVHVLIHSTEKLTPTTFLGSCSHQWLVGVPFSILGLEGLVNLIEQKVPYLLKFYQSQLGLVKSSGIIARYCGLLC